MTRPKEKDYTSQVAYTRALEAYCDSLPQLTQQKPVAWMTQARNFVHLCEFTEEEAKLYGWSAVYTSPPAQRKPLTDEQIMAIGKELGLKCRLDGNPNIDFDYARAIEAAHGIKENT